RPARSEHEAVGRVMSVGRIQPAQHALTIVGPAITRGVLREKQIRGLGDQHAAVPKLKTSRAMQMIRKNRALVRLAVAVGILQDDQLVISLFLGLPVRIARPNRYPQSTASVKRHGY